MWRVFTSYTFHGLRLLAQSSSHHRMTRLGYRVRDELASTPGCIHFHVLVRPSSRAVFASQHRYSYARFGSRTFVGTSIWRAGRLITRAREPVTCSIVLINAFKLVPTPEPILNNRKGDDCASVARNACATSVTYT